MNNAAHEAARTPPPAEAERRDPALFGLYFHWPFCQSLCPYCAFNSHVARQKIETDETTWRKAFLKEIDRVAALTRGRQVTSVYFGGGTPSLMPVGLVAAVLEAIAGRWPLHPALEVTLEANPGSAERRRLAGYAAAGVNRLSLGLQALDDDALRFLGRRHDSKDSRRALDAAQASGADVSCDFIYGLPYETPALWRKRAEEALTLGCDHVSLYMLTIETGTPFARLHQRGRLSVPGGDAAAALYETAEDVAARHGFTAYEISNYARSGAYGRHNLAYWLYGDYAGIGPGAHGRLTLHGVKHALAVASAPARWLAAALRPETATGLSEARALSPRERAEEMLMLGLRLSWGVCETRLESVAGLTLEKACHSEALATLLASDFLTRRNGYLRATPKGRLTLNAVLAELLA